MTVLPISRDFFELQLRFVDRVAALSGLPLPRVLLEYTNLYARFALGRDFDPAHPVWQEYVAGLPDGGNALEWTYRFYLTRPDTMVAPGTVATFGCFSYACPDGARLRLHFRNTERAGQSPLAAARLDQRLAELGALFEHVRQSDRRPVRVAGASWLYNLEAYRRLFPPVYLATGRVMLGRFRHMPLWGQFLDRHGRVRRPAARLFLDRLAQQSSLHDLDRCFPLPVISLEAPVSVFRAFYGTLRPRHSTGRVPAT